MMLMEKSTEKKSKLKLVIIILLVVIILLGIVIGYFVISGKKISDIKEKMNPIEEQTVLLNEFLVNLKFENTKKNYLKVRIALMYTDKKQTEVINANNSKIRDLILSELTKRNAEEILNIEAINDLKLEIIKNLNLALDGDIIKDIYFTDMVVQ